MSSLNISEQFLLACIRANGKDGFRSTLESFLKESHKIDWSLIAKTVPYVYLKVKNFHKDFKISEEIQNEVRQLYFQQVAKNEKIKFEIVKLAKEFDNAGINLIFLKGAALLSTVYDDDRDLRTMGDIDVLIRKKHLWKAEEILKNMGYKAEETEEEREILLREHFHFKYLKSEIVLELHWDIGKQWHWDLVESKDLYKNILFGSSRKITVKDAKIKTLSPAGNIFIACFNFDNRIHSTYYRIIYTPFVYLSKYSCTRERMIYNSLRFFYEIKKMLRYYGNKVKWDNLFSLAGAVRKEYEVFTLLLLAEKIVKAGIPEGVSRGMRQNIFVRLYIYLCHRIRYDNIITLFLINRVIYRAMLIWLYISNRKFYLLIKKIRDLFKFWADKSL